MTFSEDELHILRYALGCEYLKSRMPGLDELYLRMFKQHTPAHFERFITYQPPPLFKTS